MKKTTSIFSNIMHMQQLLLDQKDQAKLQKATVGVAGIGGIGSFTTEFLVRSGIGNLKLADLDTYELSNTRQLFMTTKSVGKKKVLVAKRRALDINPEMTVTAYTRGITVENFMDFCRGCDVICAQTDRISSQVLLYMAAYKYQLPVIHAGRAKWPNKHLVAVSLQDFRQARGKFKLEILGINASKWGVHDTILLEELVERAEKGQRADDIIKEIDAKNFEYRSQSFLEALKTKDVSLISEKKRSYLLKVAKENPKDFYKMAITPELCSISAALSITMVKDLILNRPIKNLAIDLYNGKVFDNFQFE